ncbi:MAG: thiamine diphosphokinase [Lachnospiraceae bacterium]|nr:thiamine diphosphokinase [Lachnospiraceae bacterium]
MMKKCVIVGAGVCNVQKLRKQIVIKDEDLCIAADGGLDYLIEIGIVPDIVLGDMDSLKMQETLTSFSAKRLPQEKDDTDMLAAIKEGLASGYEQFELYGGLGGRLSHTLANIQSLLYLLNRGARGTLFGDDVSVLLIRNESILFRTDEAECGKQISVFAFGGDAYGVSESGLKYSLDCVTLKQEFPIGVSNEFTGEQAVVEVQNGMLLICVESK